MPAFLKSPRVRKMAAIALAGVLAAAAARYGLPADSVAYVLNGACKFLSLCE